MAAQNKKNAQPDIRQPEQRFPHLYAAIALASLLFSAAQVAVAYLQKSREIDLASIQKAQEIDLATIQRARENDLAERRYQYEMNLKVVELVTTHQDKLFKGDPEDRERAKGLLLAALPAELSAALFARLKASAPGEATWAQGQKEAQLLQGGSQKTERPTVTVHFQQQSLRALANDMLGVLRRQGYNAPGKEFLPTSKAGNAIFYYHKEDLAEAQKVQEAANVLVKQQQLDFEISKLKFLGDRFVMPRGSIEVYFAGK